MTLLVLRSIARAIFGKPEVRKPGPPARDHHPVAFIVHWHNSGKPPLWCHTSLGMFDSVLYHVSFNDGTGVRRTMFEGAAGTGPFILATGRHVSDPEFLAAMLDAQKNSR